MTTGWVGVRLTVCWAGSLREGGGRNDTCCGEDDDGLREFHDKVGEYRNVYMLVVMVVRG